MKIAYSWAILTLTYCGMTRKLVVVIFMILVLSSFSYRPLIMQPSRVTSRSATIIDNMLVGNLTASISDHFPQFCFIDAFEKSNKESGVKYGRNFIKFN